MAAGFEASLIKQFNHCNAIAADILDNNKSKEIQEYAKKFAEIESPLVGERKLNGSGSIGEIFISSYVMTETFDTRLIR